MRALVVYESMFGNTRYVAEAVADGLGMVMEVEVMSVGQAVERPGGGIPDQLGLLVVGGPTHAFGMSRPGTRADAVSKHGAPAVTSETAGIREWLERLDGGTLPSGLRVATFDTRVRHPRVPGSAARRAATALRRLGCRPALAPESFWVDGVAGPLLPGETDRARTWGAQLAASVVASATGWANSR
jgi:hypothetical protein